MMQARSWNDLRFLPAVKRGQMLRAPSSSCMSTTPRVARRLAALQSSLAAQVVERRGDSRLVPTEGGNWSPARRRRWSIMSAPWAHALEATVPPGRRPFALPPFPIARYDERTFFSFFLLGAISLARPRRRLSPARPQDAPGRRAQDVSRLAAFQRPPGGLGLDTPEHDGTLVRSGPDDLPFVLCFAQDWSPLHGREPCRTCHAESVSILSP
jgi:hypothetical protein